MLKLAIFVTEYPSPSHNFVDREVIELLNLYTDIYCYSLNRKAYAPSNNSRLSILQKDTFIIKENTFSSPIKYLYVLPKLIKNTSFFLEEFFFHAKKGRGFKFFLYLIGACTLAYDLKKKRITNIHVHFANAALNIAIIAKKTLNLKVSITVHGPVDFTQPDFSFLQHYLPSLDGIRFISKEGLLKTLDKLSNQKKFQVIPCGVNLEELSHHPSEPSNNKFVILSVMRLVEDKNPFMLLKVAEILRDKNINFIWKVIGEGHLRSILEEEIKNRKLVSNIQLLGIHSNNVVRNEILNSNCCVLTSKDEGTPVFLMEAMALGRIVISTKVGNIHELIEDQSSGFLVHSNEAERMSDILIKISEDKKQNKLGLGTVKLMARKKIETSHDCKSNTKKLHDWLNSI